MTGSAARRERLRLGLQHTLDWGVTGAVIVVGALIVWQAVSFLAATAAPPGLVVEACRKTSGACWPFIAAKLTMLLAGRYPQAELGRVLAAVLLPPLAIALASALGRRFGLGGFAAATVVSLPLSFLVLAGDGFVLSEVSTELWGGLALTLMITYTGIAASLPLGLLLALARRSTWPVPRWLAIGFIEFWRGVPLVTVLFMASVMLPLFLPGGVGIDKLTRALIAIALFASAYMAEAMRGGLQSLRPSQYETAEALGLGYAQSLVYVILPQALRNALPGVVGTAIGLLKDTSLVLVIGLFDFLGMIQLAAADPAWSTPSTAVTGYAFAALVYWGLCFGISRLGALLERRGSAQEQTVRGQRTSWTRTW